MKLYDGSSWNLYGINIYKDTCTLTLMAINCSSWTKCTSFTFLRRNKRQTLLLLIWTAINTSWNRYLPLRVINFWNMFWWHTCHNTKAILHVSSARAVRYWLKHLFKSVLITMAPFQTALKFLVYTKLDLKLVMCYSLCSVRLYAVMLRPGNVYRRKVVLLASMHTLVDRVLNNVLKMAWRCSHSPI